MAKKIKISVLLVCLPFFATLSGCEVTLSPDEKRQKAIAAIGIDASVAAMMLVSAARSCATVGESNIDACVQIKGNLLDDQTAAMLAKVAVDQRTGFWKKCQADFDTEYCDQLLRRAVAIELRKPKASE